MDSNDLPPRPAAGPDDRSQPDLFGASSPPPLPHPPLLDRSVQRADRAVYARAVYAALRARLAAAVVGHAAAVDRLALLGAQHLLGTARRPARAVLIGPSGSGKTTAARALATALGCCYSVVDLPAIAENHYAGPQISDVVGDLWTQAEGDPERASKAVIVLDELDKLGMRGTVGVARDHARGRQRSLLALLGGAPVPFTVPGARDRTLMWDGSRALIISLGVFAGLPPDRPATSDDLVRRGFFQHELTERLGQLIQLDALGPAELTRVLRDGLAGSVEAYRQYGLSLTVSDEVCRAVACAVADGRLRAGPRQAVTMLEEAAQSRLLRLLAADAPVGSRVVLAPDDLELPASVRRRA